MKYSIEAETRHRIRIRIGRRGLTGEQAKILHYAFSCIPGVTGVTIYKATGGCAITYDCDRTEIIRRLDTFNFDNVQMMAKKEEESARISSAEMKKRKLDPELKRKLRLRVLGEAVADALLPLPVQLAYHAYQMVTLKDL